MSLRELVKLSGFMLIAIGTIGLLLNEFVFESPESVSHNRTIIFAVVTLVGFSNLAFGHFGMKNRM